MLPAARTSLRERVSKREQDFESACEFSQNVEVDSNLSSEMKYLLGEKLDVKEFEELRQKHAEQAEGKLGNSRKVMTVGEKKR